MLTDVLIIDVLAINALGDALVDVGAGMLTDIEVIVVVPTVITVEFFPPVSHDVDVLSAVAFDVSVKALTDVLVGAIIAAVTSIGVGVLVNVLASMVTASEFSMPMPLKESILCC